MDGAYAATLRQQLKAWEKAFIAANDGRKPARDDIKNDAAIAAKYKEYHGLQRPSTSTGPNVTPRKHTKAAPASNILRERPVNQTSATPRKPLLRGKRNGDHCLVQSPTQQPEPTPAFIRSALGPTPHRDGQVLGIFDLPFNGTPSKSNPAGPTATPTAVKGTPSKPAPDSPQSKLSRTPQSSSRRHYLEAFVGTPLKRKREEGDSGTPSTAKRRFATPAFLRRSFPLAPIAEDASPRRSVQPPFARRGLVRSLSTIIQGLKKQEQQRMDEDWDILNEIEQEASGESESTSTKAEKAAVQDSQSREMPFGPDQADVSSDEASGSELTGNAKKPWKKKGLKRQTRRVIMRPVLNKPKKADEMLPAEESEPEIIEETQLGSVMPPNGEDEHGSDDDFKAQDSGLDEASSKSVAGGKRTTKSKRGNKSKTSTAEESGRDKDDKSKPRGKVNALAHANFRKLKIKNKNSKASGRGKRFGRR